VQAAGGWLLASAILDEIMIAGFDCIQRSQAECISADSRLNPKTRLAERFPVVVDLCCGMGGLSLAARQLCMTVAAGVDIGDDALRTFARNFPDATPIEATVSGTKAIQRCETALIRHRSSEAPLVILSGPPCQGFSVAGSRDPRDKRNKVLLGVARAIETLLPHCALVENVQMLLSPKYRARVRHFEKHLKGAGYHVLPVELNAKDYGVPQKRERAFFLVTTEPLNAEQLTRRLTELRQPEISCSERLDDLPLADIRGATYDDEIDAKRHYPNHLAMRHSTSVQKKIAAIKPGNGPMSYRKLDPSNPANTLFSGHRAPPAHYAYPRSITVREAARLQGFPDDFRIYGSFANQMMQVTNAVPPPLARTVLQVLAEFTNLAFRHDA
jgi:DNA (cytosine-5)-methyltransferase 1